MGLSLGGGAVRGRAWRCLSSIMLVHAAFVQPNTDSAPSGDGQRPRRVEGAGQDCAPARPMASAVRHCRLDN
ncbi:MAG: hypothetical protein MZV64_10100 [Ignavibacteriales bacterium]|nr:hypothetical protein [Ignavibacteriales bacterium]